MSENRQRNDFRVEILIGSYYDRDSVRTGI